VAFFILGALFVVIVFIACALVISGRASDNERGASGAGGDFGELGITLNREAERTDREAERLESDQGDIERFRTIITKIKARGIGVAD